MNVVDRDTEFVSVTKVLRYGFRLIVCRQIYTADAGAPSSYRSGVAVEPMTCPPDALNSKRDLGVVRPGESLSAGWTIRRLARPRS